MKLSTVYLLLTVTFTTVVAAIPARIHEDSDIGVPTDPSPEPGSGNDPGSAPSSPSPPPKADPTTTPVEGSPVSSPGSSTGSNEVTTDPTEPTSTTPAAKPTSTTPTTEPTSTTPSSAPPSSPTSTTVTPTESTDAPTTTFSTASPTPSPSSDAPTSTDAPTTTSASPSSDQPSATSTTSETTSTTTSQPSGTSTTSTTSPSSTPTPPQVDKQVYLDQHNLVRSSVGATALKWSDDLQAKAQNYAQQCQLKHSDGALGPVGENLVAATGSFSARKAVQLFTQDESDYFSGADFAFSHFTQVVWKSTTQVGCGVALCDNLFPDQKDSATYHVCLYDPVGNVVGQEKDNLPLR